MKLIFRLFCSGCFILLCSNSYSQQKTIIKDTIVEEVVYEYDTVFIDDIKLKIDTIQALKPRFILLPVEEAKLAKVVLSNPLIFVPADTANFFVSSGISAFTTLYNLSKSTTVNGITVKQDEKYFPSYYFGFGFVKSRFVYAINTEYRQYSEVLQQTIPKNWKDTLDNGNEIYYRSIDGQLKSVIKNQYRFLQINTSVGYKLKLKNFTFTPQALIGVGFNLEENDYLLDTLAQKISVIKSTSKADKFLFAGVSCPLGYHFKNGAAIFLKPEWQHFFIAQNTNPLKYRDIFGLSFGMAYSFKPHL